MDPKTTEEDIDSKHKQNLDDQFKDDIKALAEIAQSDFLRGATPEDINRRCATICKTYLGGSWLGASKPDDIVVQRIGGGFTNQLYQVTLSDHVPTNCSQSIFDETTEPRDVSIKLYQPKHFDMIGNAGPERLPDTIISTMVSQINIGPKIYGIFSDGVLQAYYKHEQFQIKHQQNPELVRKLIRFLAQIHHLNVPFPKNRYRQEFLTQTKLQEAQAEFDLTNVATRLSLTCFLNNDLSKETKFLCKLLHGSDIPLVFCHNDFRGSNILVIDGGKELVICDFEYSGYGLRGKDLAQIMFEWDKELAELFAWKPMKIESIQSFVREYIDACELIKPGYKKQPINSLERIVREVKLMAMAQALLFTNLMLAMKPTNDNGPGSDKDQNIKLAGLFFQMYLNYKEILLKEGLITEDGQLKL